MLRIRAAADPMGKDAGGRPGRAEGAMRLPALYLGPGLLLDEGRRSLRRDGAEIPLTPTEFELLAALVAADGAIVEDGDLIARVWGDGAAVAPQTLYAHVSALRSKLGPSARLCRRYGVGYLLDPPGGQDGCRRPPWSG
jgi:DNA-binding response OmpR family regulator